MSRLVLVKIALVVAGLITFGIGIRVDNIWIRWAGIGVVAVAWVLRFAKRPRHAGEGDPAEPGSAA